MINFDEIVQSEPGFLRVTTVGKYAFDELFDFLARVKTEAERTQQTRVLIDSRKLEGSMTEAERFAGGQQIAAIFGAEVKLALIMPADKITRLGELAAVNRGADFMVTDSENEAVSFLTVH